MLLERRSVWTRFSTLLRRKNLPCFSGESVKISGLIALIYAWGFEHVTHEAGWKTGVLFSLVHIVIGGIFMSLVLPPMHPLVPEAMPMLEFNMVTPGYFMLGLGLLGLLAFVVLHVIYGAIVGAMYGPVLHPERAPA